MSFARHFGFQKGGLDDEYLLEAAIHKTGLSDFGEDSFRPGFEQLLRSLRDEARLSPLGVMIAQQEILMALGNRLQLQDYHQRHPQMGAAAIEAPIFIIGQGRSGTTIMHELLSLDPTLRVPLTWEVDFPFPPPESDSYQTDPRIEQVQKTLNQADRVLPAFKRIHRMGATLPQECVRFTTGEFASLIFWTNYNVPAYTEWLRTEADMVAVYRYHRRFLQLLQSHHQTGPWVLKSPAHLWSLDVLLDEYPDARFIQTHRDPLKMLASLTSLVTHLRKMGSGEVDPLSIAVEWARWNAWGLNASAEFRSSGRVPPERIVDIDFHEFMNSPLEQLQKIYSHLGLSLEPEVRASMQSYLDKHNAAEHGAHRYTFADTGLDVATERARVQQYQDYFHTPVEIQ
ncbi:MAG: sulfotransferase [Pseudomonadota bacterium]